MLAAGAMGTPPLLMRSRPRVAGAVGAGRAQPGRQRRPRRRDRVRPRARPLACSACAGYHEFYKGKPITTMSYDWWVGRRGVRLRRHAVHAPGDLPLLTDELPLRQRPDRARRPVVVGPAEEAGGRALVKPDRAAGDGRGHPGRDLLRCRRRAASGIRAGSGPDRNRHVQLRDVRAVGAHPGGGQRRDPRDRNAPQASGGSWR